MLCRQDVVMHCVAQEGEQPKWQECGRGSLHVNKNTESGCCRIIMRREKSKQLALNSRLFPDMMCNVNGDKEVYNSRDLMLPQKMHTLSLISQPLCRFGLHVLTKTEPFKCILCGCCEVLEALNNWPK